MGDFKINHILHDVASMNPNNSMGNQSSGNYSVSKCLVYFGIPIHCNDDAIKCVCCIVHGAMLAVSRLDNSRMLYRCEACNNGAILEKKWQVQNSSIVIFVWDAPSIVG